MDAKLVHVNHVFYLSISNIIRKYFNPSFAIVQLTFFLRNYDTFGPNYF